MLPTGQRVFGIPEVSGGVKATRKTGKNKLAIDGSLTYARSGIRTIDEVLPDAFGPRDLEEAR